MDHQNGPAPATTSIEVARVRELKTQGMEPAKIARTLKIGRASVYTGFWAQPALPTIDEGAN